MCDGVQEMRELAEKVRRLAEQTQTSVEHVLVVLTTVLLAGDKETED